MQTNCNLVRPNRSHRYVKVNRSHSGKRASLRQHRSGKAVR